MTTVAFTFHKIIERHQNAGQLSQKLFNQSLKINFKLNSFMIFDNS